MVPNNERFDLRASNRSYPSEYSVIPSLDLELHLPKDAIRRRNNHFPYAFEGLTVKQMVFAKVPGFRRHRESSVGAIAISQMWVGGGEEENYDKEKPPPLTVEALDEETIWI